MAPPQDVGILQIESQMRACLGQKVTISLLKAYQIANSTRSLVVKGVPAKVTERDFKEFLDLNEISCNISERLKRKGW